METLKSARFWISIIVLGIIGGLAFVGKIGGDVALAALMGIGGGWGIAGASTKGGLKLLLPVAFLVGFSACGATALDRATDTIPKVVSGVEVVKLAGIDIVNYYCKMAAEECQKNGVDDPQSCPGWKECDFKRTGWNSSCEALEDAAKAVNNSLKAIRAFGEKYEVRK